MDEKLRHVIESGKNRFYLVYGLMFIALVTSSCNNSWENTVGSDNNPGEVPQEEVYGDKSPFMTLKRLRLSQGRQIVITPEGVVGVLGVKNSDFLPRDWCRALGVQDGDLRECGDGFRENLVQTPEQWQTTFRYRTCPELDEIGCAEVARWMVSISSMEEVITPKQ